MFDVVIIGAGVVGTSIARELARYRLSVCVLEKQEELAFGVSKSNSGIIHPGTQNPVHSLKGRLCVQGNSLTRAVARELGVDCIRVGELILAFSQEEIFELNRLLAEGKELGVPEVRLVDQVWLRRNEPQVSAKAMAALYAPTAAIISPYRLVYALADSALANGVRIITGACVRGLEHSPSCVTVRTDKGVFQSRFIVNAAGLYADDIAAMLGITDFIITPVKGEEFILDKKRARLTRHLIFPLPEKGTKGILVTRTADGNPMIGPTATAAHDKEDLGTSSEGMEKVFAAARRLVPAIDERDIIAYFAGLRPVAGDDFIIRAEQAAPRCITVAGIQSPGLTAAAAIAPFVAGLLREQGLCLRRKLFFRRRRSPVRRLDKLSFTAARKLIRREPGYGDIVCRCELVSAQEVRDAVAAGARTMDGIKFRTRCQSGRCHGSFCTTRVMKILAEELHLPVTAVTKRQAGSEIVYHDRASDAP